MAISTYQLTVTLNDPFGSSFMDATAGATYLVTEIQTLKADIRGQSLNKTWISLVGLQGVWTGSLAWTVISGTQASIQGDQTVATGTGYIIVGNRVKAFVTAGTIYGTITVATAGGGITTVTVAWDAGAALDAGLTDIQQGIDLSKVTAGAVNYAAITNTASAWTGTLTTAIAGYVQGAQYTLKFSGAASQGSDTVALNGFAAITFKKIAGGVLVNLLPGDIPSGAIVDAVYDSAGPSMQIIGVSASVAAFARSTGNPAFDIVSSTAETTIFTKSVPANTLGTDGQLRIRWAGDFLNNDGGARTIDVKVKFGGTTVLDTGAVSIGAAANRNTIEGWATITGVGAANTQQVAGEMTYTNGGAGVANGSLAAAGVLTGSYTGLAIDTTSAQTLAVTVTLGTSSANVEYRSYAVFVDLVNP